MGPRGPIQRGDNTGYRYTLRAFRQVGDAPVEYLTPESTFWERSFALAVSADGDTVAGIRVRGANDNDEQGFVWRADGTFVTIPYAQPFDFRMDVNGMSADGTKVVGTSESAGFAPFRAFRWTQEEGTVQLPRPAGTTGIYESFGNAISGNGRFIAGDVFTPQYDGAVIWDGITAPMLVPPPEGYFANRMFGISDDGATGFGVLARPGGSDYAIWTSALGWEDPDDYFIRMGVQLPQGWNTDYVFDMSSDGTVFSIIGGSSVPGVSGIAVISVPSVATCTTLFLALPWCCPARRRRLALFS